MTKVALSFLAVLSIHVLPAYGDHLSNGATWGHLGYHTACFTHQDWQYTPGHQPDDVQLKSWFTALKEDLLACSTSEEKDFEHRTVSCSFRLNHSGQLSEFRIQQSAGSADIDSKFMDLIKRVNLRKIPPPPSSKPFQMGIVASYEGTPETLSVSLKVNEK